MIRELLIAGFAAALLTSSALGEEHSRKKTRTSESKSKTETAASCKMPAVGQCPSCAITCRPGETATCGPGAGRRRYLREAADVQLQRALTRVPNVLRYSRTPGRRRA